MPAGGLRLGETSAQLLFPLIQKLLLMFGLSNTPLLVGVTVGSYLIFGVLYAVMYKATSRSYYQLVK